MYDSSVWNKEIDNSGICMLIKNQNETDVIILITKLLIVSVQAGQNEQKSIIP